MKPLALRSLAMSSVIPAIRASGVDRYFSESAESLAGVGRGSVRSLTPLDISPKYFFKAAISLSGNILLRWRA